MAKISKDINLLHLTLLQRDIITLPMCYRIWKVCNGKQFEHMPGSDFANFLNLRPTQNPVKIKNREKLRVCYLIYFLSKKIPDNTMSQQWKEDILSICKISEPYYKSHYRDAVAEGNSQDNKDFVEDLGGIFK